MYRDKNQLVSRIRDLTRAFINNSGGIRQTLASHRTICVPFTNTGISPFSKLVSAPILCLSRFAFECLVHNLLMFSVFRCKLMVRATFVSYQRLRSSIMSYW